MNKLSLINVPFEKGNGIKYTDALLAVDGVTVGKYIDKMLCANHMDFLGH